MTEFNETFLARWIAGDASAEEVKAFQKHPEYKSYVKLKQAAGRIDFKDFNEDKAFEKIQQRIQPKKTKRSFIKPYLWLSAVAACTLIFLGVYAFLNQKAIYTTNVGQTRTVSLPDGSEMILNADAEARFNTNNWNNNRNVFLTGEAFFKVKKGNTFTVSTTVGSVTVVGTSFTVNTVADNLLTVKCFEGKVKVAVGQTTTVLTKGMAVQQSAQVLEEWQFTKTTPSWLTSNTTTLYQVPINEALALLQRQYQLKILNKERIAKDLKFTGTFVNDNISEAIYSIFEPLGVDYELIGTNEIRILTD